MAKRAGYVYQRPGRSGKQVTGAGVAQTPEAYARRGRTPEDRAEGRFMQQARKLGWSTDKTELGTRTHVYSKGGRVGDRGPSGGGIDAVIEISGGRATGRLISRERSHLKDTESEAAIAFNPTRGIPTPAQARAAFGRRLRMSLGS